jgi:hypothetical protein
MASKNPLDQWLRSTSKSWRSLAQAAVWTCGVIAGFLLPPPVGTSEQQHKIWLRLAQFVVAVLIGLVFVVALKWGRKRHAKYWWVTSFAFLVVSIVSFFIYQYLIDIWTCNYFAEKVVVGTTYTERGRNYVAGNPGIPCDSLLEDFLGRAEQIWERNMIDERRFILAGSYILCLPFVTICLFGVVQAIHCLTQGSA